jgi:hypothetical protein
MTPKRTIFVPVLKQPTSEQDKTAIHPQVFICTHTVNNRNPSDGQNEGFREITSWFFISAIQVAGCSSNLS